MDRPRLSFVHLTDCHLGQRPGARVYGADTGLGLEAVIAHINALKPQPSFAVFGGDLVSPDLGSAPFEFAESTGHRKYEDAYEYFRSVVGRLNIPKYFVVGNHDHRASMRKVLLNEAPGGDPYDYHFEAAGYAFVVLDTQDPGRVPGLLDEAQLTWLERMLAGIPADRPVVVVSHHPPVSIGIPYLDQFKLQNPERLFEILGRFANVRWMLCGHVHNERVVHAPLEMLITPSTGFQFRMRDGEVAVVPGEPAYRLITLDGERMETRVVRVDA